MDCFPESLISLCFTESFICLHTLATSVDWKVPSYKIARETNLSTEFLPSP